MSIKQCPLCGHPRCEVFLHRESVSVHQHLLMNTPDQARAIPHGELAMSVCPDCGFVFNKAFDLDLLSYGQDYDNNQACSSSFQQHLDMLVAMLLDEKDVRGRQVVEVGCGQGAFLRRLVEEGENRGVGFDPSYRGPKQACDGRIHFESRYYDAGCSEIPADVVICRHVIEHVPDPLLLLRSVRAAIGERSQARVFFETPCVDWILANTVIWDFFYEHCSLFSAASLSTAFQIAGFTVDEVRHVFGGQYLWIEASPLKSAVVLNGEHTRALALDYAKQEQSILHKWQQHIASLSMDGGVALWGAGAKGVTFANLIDPQRQLIDCLVDLNPNKQGRYVAGSGHPIVDPMQLNERGIANAILMNPVYREECEAILRRAKIATNLI